MFSSKQRDQQLHARLDELRRKTPVPVFWLFGKTQTGKTSVIKFLTGAAEAEIGQGFRPCTKYSRVYHFPTVEAPLLTFLDTRGLDEPGYDPEEDLAAFDKSAHVIIVTVKALDHAQHSVLESLQRIRDQRPSRPVVLLLTCLHEAYPQQQHGPYDSVLRMLDGTEENDLARTMREQLRRFRGVVDRAVPIDFTRVEEGFTDPWYGGEELRNVLVAVLPAAYRQTLLTLEEGTRDLQDLYAQHALPHILGYSVLAASVGAFPIPWLDLFILPGVQTRMVYHLAQYYGQPLSAQRFGEFASSIGIGVVTRQAIREVAKFIPFVGSVTSAALAAASTFALGKAFCYYYRAVHQGHVPQPQVIARYYNEQLALAEKTWLSLHKARPPAPATATQIAVSNSG